MTSVLLERKHESRIVKNALIEAGYTGVKVGHGTGTAWGWLDIHADTGDDWQRTYDAIIRIAQQVTGRHGEYDGQICLQLRSTVTYRILGTGI